MPNARVHAALGIGSGIGIALVGHWQVPDEGRLVFVAGAAAGGWAGGRLPDALEPAVHSWHRSLFHSAMTAAGVITLGVGTCAEWCKDILASAAEIRARRLQINPADPSYNGLWWAEYAKYFLAGLIVGLPAGYVSHLVADFTTPRCIPLLGLKVS